MVDKERDIIQEHLDNVGIDIPETLKRARLDGVIPRSRLITLAVLLEAMARDKEVHVEGRLAYGNATRWLKETLEMKEDHPDDAEFERRSKVPYEASDLFYEQLKFWYKYTLAWKCKARKEPDATNDG